MVPFVDIVRREGDASTRYKLALAGPGGDGAARRASIRRSERVAALLSERGHDDCIAQHPTRDGRARIGFSPPLADLGYQPGDMALLPPARPGSGVVARRTSAAPGGRRVLTPILMIAGRARIHASLEGNALYAFLALGLANQRAGTGCCGSCFPRSMDPARATTARTSLEATVRPFPGAPLLPRLRAGPHSVCRRPHAVSKRGGSKGPYNPAARGLNVDSTRHRRNREECRLRAEPAANAADPKVHEASHGGGPAAAMTDRPEVRLGNSAANGRRAGHDCESCRPSQRCGSACQRSGCAAADPAVAAFGVDTGR